MIVLRLSLKADLWPLLCHRLAPIEGQVDTHQLGKLLKPDERSEYNLASWSLFAWLGQVAGERRVDLYLQLFQLSFFKCAEVYFVELKAWMLLQNCWLFHSFYCEIRNPLKRNFYLWKCVWFTGSTVALICAFHIFLFRDVQWFSF